MDINKAAKAKTLIESLDRVIANKEKLSKRNTSESITIFTHTVNGEAIELPLDMWEVSDLNVVLRAFFTEKEKQYRKQIEEL